MNVRHQLYKKYLLQGMEKGEAAIKAGYSKTTALKHTADLDRRIGLDKVLTKSGLSDHYLAHKHKQLIESVKVIGYLHHYKQGDKGGLEKLGPEEVVSNEFIEVPDTQAMAKGIELAYKLKGHLKDKVEHSGEVKGGGSRVVVFVSEGKDIDKDKCSEGRLPASVFVEPS
jgi:phage terminase small subunit